MANTSASPSADLTMPSNFRAARCLAGGELTPPDSPELPCKTTQRHGQKMRIPRLLRREKPEADLPPPLPRSTTFRRVDKMTEPFPLVLPDSPIESDSSSFCSKSPTVAPELRRRSPTYNDLRLLAAKHKETVARRVDSPLLPSPVIKENHIQSDSYFTFHNPRPRPTAYRSYEDLHILSHYCDGDLASDRYEAEEIVIPSSLSQDSLVIEGEDTHSVLSDGAPLTPNDEREQKGAYCSNESGWLANKTSCLERERKFRARCTQVVQSPVTGADETDSQIMIAKLAGPRKPRLVHISRPSSQASSGTNEPFRADYTPRTPPRPLEVSRFSPDDTPSSPFESRSSRSSRSTPCLSRSSATESVIPDRRPRDSLMPAPLALRPSQSNRSSSTVYSSTLEKLAALSDPFGASPHRKASCEPDPNASDWTIPTNAWPVPPKATLRDDDRASSRVGSLDFISSLEIRIRQLRQSIATVTAVINTFPEDILCLKSPFVCSIRAPHISDATYIHIFEKIFPHAPIPILSALAAWLIIDLWFEQTIITSSSPGRDDELTAEDVLHSQHAVDFWTLPNQPSPPSSPDLSHGLPSPEVDSYISYAWDANSPLRRIPMKARCLLGITESTLLNEGLLRAHEAALVRRMRVIRPSITVVGQKLIEALRGQWDVDVWRCLRVLVEVIEDSPLPPTLGARQRS